MDKVKNTGLIVISIVIAVILMAISGVLAVVGAIGFTSAFIYGGGKLYMQYVEETEETEAIENNEPDVTDQLSDPK
jgi:hypothetical protein